MGSRVGSVTHEVYRVRGEHVIRQFASHTAAQAFKQAVARRFKVRRYAVRKIQGVNHDG